MAKPYYQLPLLLILFLIGCLQSQAQQKEFGWLVGKWKLKEKNVFEEWKISADKKTLEGLSYRIKEGDTTVMEKLLIKFEQPFFFYISEVAENPEHDFPKGIRYKLIRKDNHDFIEAAIEGDGKIIPYSLTRLK